MVERNLDKNKQTKAIYVSEEAHRRLKYLSFSEKKTIGDLTNEIILSNINVNNERITPKDDEEMYNI